jgi:hypothetical protein
MCYLVTIGTHESQTSLEVLLGRDAAVAVRPATNPSLRTVFPPGDNLFEVTSGHCSCDLVVEAAESSAASQLAKLRARYEGKGWSKAKIARALADWEAAHERRELKHAAPQRQFYGLLRALVSRPVGVRLVVHFYSGQFNTEDVRVVGAITISEDRLGEAGVLGENKLTQIRALNDRQDR